MSKRLVINLAECDACDQCEVNCGYFYRARPEDHGILTLRERATFLLVCRRCEEPSCVDACPAGALERGTDGVIKRGGLRCVSCKLCTQACPFGTIYPDMVPYYVTPCDYCLGEYNAEPPCVGSCPRDAIAYRDVEPDESGTHILDDHLAVQSTAWIKREVFE